MVLKFLFVWVVMSLPDNLDCLLECSWDKSAFWDDLDGNIIRRGVNVECNWCCFAWVIQSELSYKVPIVYPEIKLVVWGNIDEM